MRFIRLKLENWRNFTEVDVPLQRRVFLAGPNASGKSNLLDAFRFLQDLVKTGGGLQEAVSKRGGISSIRSLFARRSPSIFITTQIGNDIDEPEWTYELRFTHDRKRALIEQEAVFHKGKQILKRPNPSDKKDKELLTQTHLEQISANIKFRKIVELFNSVTYLHLVPQLIRDPNRYVYKENDPFGGDFLEQIFKTTEKTRNKRLSKIKDSLRIAVPQLEDLNIERDNQSGELHLRGLYKHWRPNAGWQSEQQFSDGTLRLMGFLWAMLNGKGPLLLEEPELSLHPGIVKFIPQMLAKISHQNKRQVLLSSHSRDLFHDSGIAPDEVLLLSPSKEGTKVDVPKDNPQILNQLHSGIPMSDVIESRTTPKNVEQLSLF